MIIRCELWSADRDATEVGLRLKFAAPAWPAAIVSNWLTLADSDLHENCRYFVVLESDGIGQDDPRFLSYEVGACHDT
ncbi:MAG TPA: hypothetical protein VHY20_08615 [Pirellulales bacterium]|nr:hypothetical protein [Pirellulales bacterium]